MGGISSRASTKVFPSYSTKMKAITQEKVLILYNPFEVNLQTDFDFFSGLNLRLGKIRLTSTTTQVVKQQQIENARNHIEGSGLLDACPRNIWNCSGVWMNLGS